MKNKNLIIKTLFGAMFIGNMFGGECPVTYSERPLFHDNKSYPEFSSSPIEFECVNKYDFQVKFMNKISSSGYEYFSNKNDCLNYIYDMIKKTILKKAHLKTLKNIQIKFRLNTLRDNNKNIVFADISDIITTITIDNKDYSLKFSGYYNF